MSLLWLWSDALRWHSGTLLWCVLALLVVGLRLRLCLCLRSSMRSLLHSQILLLLLLEILWCVRHLLLKMHHIGRPTHVGVL